MILKQTLRTTTAVDPEEDDGQGGNPPTGDSDDGRQYGTGH